MQNLDEVKKQLSDFSAIVAKYKSEKVQLRIVEFLLSQISDGSVDIAQAKSSVKNRKRTNSRKKDNKNSSTDKQKVSKKRKSSGKGASATLTTLISEGFFSSPKSINDIIAHCDINKASKFKANEFSGKLARLTRDDVLDRTQNSEGVYEYTKK